MSVKNKLDYNKPINVGTSYEISISDLAEKIKSLTKYNGEIVFTGDISDGQPRRMLNCERIKTLLGWQAKVDLTTGLNKTIEWYENNL